jgi:hypothetical protein
VFAVVRFTHRLHRYDRRPETLHPSQPILLSLALPQDDAEESSPRPRRPPAPSYESASSGPAPAPSPSTAGVGLGA